jgi:hypothetical protein
VGLSEEITVTDCWARMNELREYVDDEVDDVKKNLKDAEDRCWGGIGRMEVKLDRLYWWIIGGVLTMTALLAGILFELVVH